RLRGGRHRQPTGGAGPRPGRAPLRRPEHLAARRPGGRAPRRLPRRRPHEVRAIVAARGAPLRFIPQLYLHPRFCARSDMGDANRVIGFVVILVLYLSIGVMAAAGCVAIARRFLRPKLEQVFYGLFLVMIAAFYLAFTAYFQVGTAWRLESL